MDKPWYTHDCDRCRYLGAFEYDAPLETGSTRLTVDLYHCPGILGGSIIARYGHDGPEYASGPVDVYRRRVDSPSMTAWTYGPALLEALKRL